MEEKAKDKGLGHFLRWEAARDQDLKGHPRKWPRVLAFILFICILFVTCVLTFWT